MIRTEAYGPVVKLQVARPVLGRPFYHTAAYWVDGLLVDTGCAHTAAEFVEATASLCVVQIVNTHSHEDHIGANGPLQRARGCRVLAHPDALAILADPRLQYLQPYRRFFWGWPQPSLGEAVGDWVETERYRFRVIPTPGHVAHHIALYEPRQGWLFSGDAYIGGRDVAARPDYDVGAIIASLKALAALPAARLFPGSGTVRDNPSEELMRKAAQMEAFGAEVRRLHGEGLSVGEIKRRLLGRETRLTYITAGHFSGTNLIRLYLDSQA